MLNPLKNLAGRLNHLLAPHRPLMRVIQIANALRPASQSALTQHSAEDILALKSPTGSIDARVHHKFQFDLDVHTAAARFSDPSTVLDQPNPHERKRIHLLNTHLGRLNSRQLAYLHLAIRARINRQWPNWSNLHINPQSPSKGELQMLPNLGGVGDVGQLRTLKKKGVMKEVLAMKESL